MLAIFWVCAALIFIVLASWLLLARCAKQIGRRISQPLITMMKVAGLSGLVFLLASVTSYVACMVNPEILPFIMPYSPILFAISFIVFIHKLESKRSDKYQAVVALWLAASVTAALIIGQSILGAVDVL